MTDDTERVSRTIKTASVPISLLEQALTQYTRSAAGTASVDWRRMGWVWEQLPWYAKMMAIVGIFYIPHIQRKFVLPVIAHAATPYLEKYMKGDWRRQEEERFRDIFLFFKQEKAALFFPAGIAKFVEETVNLPSFIQAKELWRERLLQVPSSLSSKVRAALPWHRYETYYQYTQRLAAFEESLAHHKDGKTDVALSSQHRARPLSSVQAPTTEEPTAEQNRWEKQQRLLNKHAESLINEMRAYKLQLQGQLIPKALLLRHDDSTLSERAEQLYEKTITLLLHIEEIQEYFPENISRYRGITSYEQDAHAHLHMLEDRLQQIHNDWHEVCAELPSLKRRIQELHDYLQSAILQLFKLIDATPLLTVGSLLRAQELRIIKFAREKLKQYRLSLVRAPGPTLSFQRIEEEIRQLLRIAHDFHREGREIEDIKTRLEALLKDSNLMHAVSHPPHAESSEETSVRKTDMDLNKMLEKVSFFKKNIEILADRQEQFERVVKELSSYEKRESME